ncbi:hypothetical protein KFK09_001050 [Dendrobium nobile]|uniref:Uncharacterized protein n=1 Tax=Dendrobium nobile TaxID=94219 RepID=A0A8T3CA63_DENNO|nr:hypothetical protein KFK09_001050 [Dendrobium nobile]
MSIVVGQFIYNIYSPSYSLRIENLDDAASAINDFNINRAHILYDLFSFLP